MHRALSPTARQTLLELPRHTKRALLVLLDFLTLSGVLWLAMTLRYGVPYWPHDLASALLAVAGPALTIATFAYAGMYRLVTRYLGTHGHTRIVASVLFSVLVWSALVFMVGQRGLPRSVIVIYAVIGSAAAMLARYWIASILKSSGVDLQRLAAPKDRHAVIIYGAGQAGLELAGALARVPGRQVVGFCDLSPTLWGQYVGGHKVYRPAKLAHTIERFDVKEVLIALPGSSRQQRRLILKELETFPVKVNVMASMDDIATGRIAADDLRPVDVADLLGRDSVPPVSDLLSRNTSDKNLMVTGAGGSVGSELVRQLLRHGPARIVLFDLSETALFEIDMEARERVAALPVDRRPEIVPVLGSVLDAQLIADVLKRYAIATVYHAAAYKHVPMVERNVAVGLANNIFGTEVLAEAAVANGVERVVLISTDKAVRPTNVMGASKRIAELVLQAGASQNPSTVFTMVRFGNVLDSSGSVVGRFRRQIKAGGPVTVTHPEVIRYFMSIPEAAELVIQAGAMAKGGEVFVLDMGEPVKIVELAQLMIRLSGLEPKDDAHPNGDIEIVFTGLRPGEKLYEELLIRGAISGSEHPRIMRSDEPFLTPAELRRELDLLRAAIALRDTDAIQAILLRTVEGYRPDEDARLETKTAATWVSASRTLH